MHHHTACSRSVVYIHSGDEWVFILEKKPQPLLLAPSTCLFVLRCVAVCCSVLQCVAVCCNYLLQVHAVSDAHMSPIRLFIGNVYDQSSKNVSENLLPCSSGHLYLPKVSVHVYGMNVCKQVCMYSGNVRLFVRVCARVCVCMYVCMYVCLYFFMHAYLCVCAYVCTNVSMDASMCVCTCMHVCISKCVCVRCLSVSLCVCLSACIHISIYVRTEMNWDTLVPTYTHWAF